MTTPDRRSTLPTRLTSTLVLSLLLALVMIGVAVVSLPSQGTQAASAELVTNPTFDENADGWEVKGAARYLRQGTIDGDDVARVTTGRTLNAVLRNSTSTVSESGAVGTTYEVTARVRTKSPNVKGAVRVVETAGAGTKRHLERFWLGDEDWHTVTLTVETTRADAELDLELVAWNLPRNGTLLVDSVSMKLVGGGPIPIAPPPTSPTPPAGDSCSAPVPSGTTFGSSIYPVGISSQASLRQNDTYFGKLPIVRDFFPGLPPKWDSGRAKLLRDRQVIISFKLTPQAILSGRHDAFFRNWFDTAPTDQTIYWTFHHEPEGEVKRGDFSKAQYRNAWARLGAFEKAACKPNMHGTQIFSDWVVHPLSGDDYRDYDPGKGVVDVIAFDPYNRIFQPGSSAYDSPDKILGNIVTAMEKDGRPFGLAELGSRIMRNDPDGERRAQWLRKVGDYAIANDFAFVSYFQSTVGADWRLRDSRSTNMWTKYVGGSPH